jgi:integration host factor subunit alpha
MLSSILGETKQTLLFLINPKDIPKGGEELMNIRELSDAVHTGSVDMQSQEAADRVVRIIIKTIKASLEAGEPVKIAGFGTFVPLLRKESRIRSISTGEIMIIPARIVVKFKQSRTLTLNAE